MNEAKDQENKTEIPETIEQRKPEEQRVDCWNKPEFPTDQQERGSDALSPPESSPIFKLNAESPSDNWVEGFESPHKSKDFAERAVVGTEIKEQIDSASTTGNVFEGVSTVFRKSSEFPLGEGYEKWFKEEYGRYPNTEAREAAEDRQEKGAGEVSEGDSNGE